MNKNAREGSAAEFIRIDEAACIQCGACAAVCPGGLLLFREGSYPRPVPRAEVGCLRCGHCAAACPSDALVHREISLEECPPIDRQLGITPEQCEMLIKGRRSIRAYQDKLVPREVIRRLIDTARYAPTGHNAQEIEWLVVDDPQELRRLEIIGGEWLRSVIRDQPQMAAAMNMEVLVKKHEKNPTTFLRGAPALVVVHAPSSPMAVIDGSIALSYFDLFANSLGLGCCWAGFIYIMAVGFQPMKDALALPEGRVAGGCMLLGYPAVRYHRVPVRRQPKISWSHRRSP
jgi:nitroreductase/NAD-dependent dihydropyrimidine dehydrogenase PreA subunit